MVLRALRGRKVMRDIDGLVETMRDENVRIGKVNLVAKDGDQIVVLIGIGPRADDLGRAFDLICPAPSIRATFDPPTTL